MKSLHIDDCIDFQCAACGELIHVPEGEAGELVNCPHCLESHRVPIPKELLSDEKPIFARPQEVRTNLDHLASKAKPTPIRSANYSWGGRFLTAFGFVVSVITGICLIAAANSYYPPSTTEVIVLLVLFAVSWSAFLAGCIIRAIERGSCDIAYYHKSRSVTT